MGFPEIESNESSAANLSATALFNSESTKSPRKSICVMMAKQIRNIRVSPTKIFILYFFSIDLTKKITKQLEVKVKITPYFY